MSKPVRPTSDCSDPEILELFQEAGFIVRPHPELAGVSLVSIPATLTEKQVIENADRLRRKARRQRLKNLFH